MKIFKKKNTKINKKKGFTILEMMVAIGIFLIVITYGMGALLNAHFLHNKSEDMRSIMDNLTFIMEDISRNARVGYGYNLSGDTFSFKKTENGTEYSYSYSILNGYITREIDGEQVQLNPDEVDIDYNASGFTVVGAENGDNQPLVEIRLSGKITYQGKDTPFSIQTSVSQRQLDVMTP